MKKIIFTITTAMLLFSLFGCNSNKADISPMDVSKSIADVYSDDEGNVMVQLLDGRIFHLGNMKGPQGERGLQGEKGETGAQGPQGPQGPAGSAGSNGRDGTDGLNGTNGVNGKDGENPTDYVKGIELRNDRYLYAINGDGTEDYVALLPYNGKYKIFRRYHYGENVVVDDKGKDPSYTHFNEGGSGEAYASCDGHYTDDDLKTTNYKLVKAECSDATVSEGTVDQHGYVTYTLSNLPGKDIYIDFYYEKTEKEEEEGVDTRIEVTFPSDGASYSDLQQFAKQYSFIYCGKWFDETIDQDYFEIINEDDGSVIPNGSTVKVPYFTDSDNIYSIRYHQKYYVNAYTQTSSSSGRTMTLISTYDSLSEFDKWEYTNNIEGLKIENTESPDVILLKAEAENVNGEIKITAKTNNGSAYVVVTVTNGVIRMTDNSEW